MIAFQSLRIKYLSHFFDQSERERARRRGGREATTPSRINLEREGSFGYIPTAVTEGKKSLYRRSDAVLQYKVAHTML